MRRRRRSANPGSVTAISRSARASSRTSSLARGSSGTKSATPASEKLSTRQESAISPALAAAPAWAPAQASEPPDRPLTRSRPSSARRRLRRRLARASRICAFNAVAVVVDARVMEPVCAACLGHPDSADPAPGCLTARSFSVASESGEIRNVREPASARPQPRVSPRGTPSSPRMTTGPFHPASRSGVKSSMRIENGPFAGADDDPASGIDDVRPAVFGLSITPPTSAKPSFRTNARRTRGPTA